MVRRTVYGAVDDICMMVVFVVLVFAFVIAWPFMMVGDWAESRRRKAM